jgi:hypothetical protein
MPTHTAANWSFAFGQLSPEDRLTCAFLCLEGRLPGVADTLPAFDDLDPTEQDIVVHLTELAALFAQGVLRPPHPPGVVPPIVMEAHGELPPSVDPDRYDGMFGDEVDGINLYGTYLHHRLSELEAVLKPYTFQQ